MPMVNTIKGFAKDRLFGKILHGIKVEELLTNENGENSRRVFAIVHWNAPHFLLLNVKKLELLHPESKIYVFDNASSEANLKVALNGLKCYRNLTLFSNRYDLSETWASHIVGLQFLLNYAFEESDSVITFLDQDCILVDRVDDLIGKLGKEILLVGIRDYLEIPENREFLKKGHLRNFPDAVHGSFMMMQPIAIHRLLGDQSLMDGKLFEAYHGIAHKLAGKILFLEMRMHPEIPLLTSYMHEEKTYVWHSWYSSRMTGMKDTEVLNGLPVSWIKGCLEKAYAFMEGR